MAVLSSPFQTSSGDGGTTNFTTGTNFAAIAGSEFDPEVIEQRRIEAEQATADRLALQQAQKAAELEQLRSGDFGFLAGRGGTSIRDHSGRSFDESNRSEFSENTSFFNRRNQFEPRPTGRTGDSNLGVGASAGSLGHAGVSPGVTGAAALGGAVGFGLSALGIPGGMSVGSALGEALGAATASTPGHSNDPFGRGGGSMGGSSGGNVGSAGGFGGGATGAR